MQNFHIGSSRSSSHSTIFRSKQAVRVFERSFQALRPAQEALEPGYPSLSQWLPTPGSRTARRKKRLLSGILFFITPSCRLQRGVTFFAQYSDFLISPAGAAEMPQRGGVPLPRLDPRLESRHPGSHPRIYPVAPSGAGNRPQRPDRRGLPDDPSGGLARNPGCLPIRTRYCGSIGSVTA